MKIFFYSMRPFDELPVAEQISQEMDIELGWTTEYPSLNNAKLAAGYDAVSFTPCTVNEPLIEAFHQVGVKYLLAHSIGFDHIDLDAARKYGMRVANVTYPANGVANYAIMMMMMCLRRMPYIMASAAVQDFSLKNKIGTDISFCTVGIIGTGNIGATVARHLSSFGCRILAYDIAPKPDLPVEYVDLETLWKSCDVITLHAPATAQNYHLICEESIKQMKPGVCIVNTARGKLVDTDALIAGLSSGKVGSAALDVMEQEDGLYYANRMYDVIDNPNMGILRAMPNVILSPHTAFYTREDVEHMVRGNFESLYHFEKNIPDSHVIV